MNSRKSVPVTRSMSSASTQCADVGWYSKRVPGSQLQRHCANRASRRSRSSQSSGAERRAREARRVQHHLLDGDDVLAVRPELGHELGDAARHVDRALAHQDPHRRRDDRLRRREDHVARLGRGRAERDPHRELPVARERELARRKAAFVDLALRAGDQLGERGGVDAVVRRAPRRPCGRTARRSSLRRLTVRRRTRTCGRAAPRSLTPRSAFRTLSSNSSERGPHESRSGSWSRSRSWCWSRCSPPRPPTPPSTGRAPRAARSRRRPTTRAGPR